MTRKPKSLSPEDRAIWAHVARTVRPYGAKKSAAPEVQAAAATEFGAFMRGAGALPLTRAPHGLAEGRAVIPRSVIKRPANPTAFPTAFPGAIHAAPKILPAPQWAPKPVQTTTDKRIRRGKTQIDFTLDLHDMTQDAAFARLIFATVQTRQRGGRCMLVITGKGGVVHGGVLRKMLPIWLAQPELARHIASFSPAHQRHGGGGAFYIFLKRPK